MVHRGILVRIEDFARTRYGVVFLFSLLLVIGALLLGRNLRLDSDILTMLPKDNPEISEFRGFLEDFGSLDYLLVLVEAPDGQQVLDSAEAVERLAEKVGSLPHIAYLDYRLDEHSPLFRLFEEHAPLFLDDAGLDRLQGALTDEALDRRAETLRAALESPASLLFKHLLSRDPLGLAPVYLEGLFKGRGPLRVDLSSGYYISSDGRALLLIVKPDHPPQDVGFSEVLKKQVEEAFAASEPPEGLTMRLGGGYIIAIEDSNLIKSDLKRNAVISFVAVVALYWFCYRRISAIFYSVVPLLVGQALTFAIAVLVLGGLNNATAGFTAMLMGLGTDFTIVMYGRYIEERQAGASLATATHRMMGETALGVFTGAITSAGTFGAVCVSRFPGLRDFGFLVGAGILLCMVAILFLLPAMIAWNDGRRPRRGNVVEKLYLHSFGVEKLLVVADRRPKAVLALCGVVTLAAAGLASRIELSDSYRDLRSPNNAGFLVQEEVSRRFGGNFTFMAAISRGATEEAALESARRVTESIQPWIASGDLGGYDSLASLVPSETRQQAAMARLNAAGPAYDTQRITMRFREALARQGFRAGAFEEALGQVGTRLHPRETLKIADLQHAGLDALLGRYLAHVGGEARVATLLFPADARWINGPPPEFRAAVENADGTRLTGLNVVGIEIKRLFRADAALALLLGLSLVAVLLTLDFRSPRLTLYGMLQLLTGVLWMIALMSVSGIQMNFVNAFATTMILGVGIDYGIHLIHRIWEERSLTSFGVLETGKAVVMAALTNVAGFGAVAMSNYPGVASMGRVCLFGTACCLVTSLTLLPALLKLFPERRTAPPPSE